MPLNDVRTEFTSAAVSQVNSVTDMSHTVSRGTLRGSNKKWIKKEMNDPGTAQLEILAQEFFRLIIPQQPETRLLSNPQTGVSYILSEEVPGYRSLPTKQAASFGNGTYTGLGQAVVVAMFLEEIDLKNGNIGLDNQNRVIKIDGDWSFAGFDQKFGAEKYDITPDAIEKLPFCSGFYAWNWFDVMQQGSWRSSSSIISMSLSNNPQFRAEVNQAMLKICLLPDDYLECFVDAFIPAGGQNFVTLLNQRRDALRDSALQNESFKAYLQSDQAASDAQALIRQMNSFIANGEAAVLKPELHKTMADQVFVNLINLNPNVRVEEFAAAAEKVAAAEEAAILDRLRENFQLIQDIAELKADPQYATIAEVKVVEQGMGIEQLNKLSLELRDEYLNSLVNEVDRHRVNDNDEQMVQFINEMKEEIKLANLNDPKSFELLKAKLNQVLEAVSSPEVAAVKKAAQSLRDNKHWYTSGKLDKANNIEEALCKTALLDRKTIITQEGAANKVQEELARHRHFGKTGTVYKKDGQIDVQKAARTFKDLKDQFAETKLEAKQEVTLESPRIK